MFDQPCTTRVVHNGLLKFVLDNRDSKYITRVKRFKAVIPVSVLTTDMLTYGLGLSGLVFAMIFVGIPAMLFCKD